MKVYYAHGGGYTEIYGLKNFLKKIRNDLEYGRIFPARFKLPKINKNKNEEGDTGKKIFKKLKERLKYSEHENSILLVIDDGDCLFYNKERSFMQSLEDFKKFLKEKNIKGIFLYIEPEIEKFLCIDKSWIKNNKCEIKEKDIYSLLEELLENYNYELNKDKNGCKVKFSDKLEEILKICGIIKRFSKKTDGSEYLKKIDPYKIAKEDKDLRNFINEVNSIKISQ
ncbi:MAG: hypothetical protein DSY60_00720 [Persephonella sp.]|nr:MAG: hypothetical protein DSY60_00720 [Persephonella sp.]